MKAVIKNSYIGEARIEIENIALEDDKIYISFLDIDNMQRHSVYLKDAEITCNDLSICLED